jgi:uncharacterized damage-inducible protein DinB
MTVRDFVTLFDYGYWTNGKLFAAAARLTLEQFAGTVDGRHGSVRNTLVHVLNAERAWLGRFAGLELGPALDPADFQTAGAIAEAWEPVEAGLRAFLATLPDEALAREVGFTVGGTTAMSMPLSRLLQQVVCHSVHHRGQVSLVLRLLGHDPENFDVFLYHAERHRSRAR